MAGWLRREAGRPVAAHAARVPYALGLASLAMLALAGLAGLPLALRYRPDEVPQLLAAQPLAALRALHAWAASILLVLVLAHLLRVALTAAHRPPRRRMWFAGLAMLAALLALFWLGTALRGDQQSFEAWRHGADALALLGVRAPAQPPLAALFWLHVLALPLALAAALALKLRWLRRLDLAPLPGEGRVPFRAHARAGLRVALPAAALVALLAWAAPPALGPAPLPQLEAARPPWPFAWLAPLQDALGTPGILLGLLLLFGTLAVLPWLDARGQRWGQRRAALAVLALLVALVAGLGALALLGPAPVRLVG
jgi:quinol-cytochrome oxidoreductase complex cytochrome b subunit